MANAKVQQARCGCCGGQKHTVWMDDSTAPTVIELRCCDCSTATKITVGAAMYAKPKGRSLGSIAVF
jgi:hypothetical protein